MKKWISFLLAMMIGLSCIPSLAEESAHEPPKSIKILAIGNSHTRDALEYLWNIYKNAGYEEIILGELYIGGCSLTRHNAYVRNDKSVYEYHYNDKGFWTATNNYSPMKAILSQEWDYFILQQHPVMSGNMSNFNQLQKLVDYLHEVKTNPNAQIYWHMSWAFQADCTDETFLKTYAGDQERMYRDIVTVGAQLTKRFTGLAGVLPTGTAIQNLRTSELGDTLTRDGLHLTRDYGQYAAALTFFTTLSGISPETITWKPAAFPNSASKRDLVNRAVTNAVYHPYTVTSFAKPQVSPAQTAVPATNQTSEIPKSIKILAIGNSFAMDAMEHLWNICHSVGIEEVYLGYLYYPGAHLNMHFINTRNGALAYEYYTNTNGRWKMEKGSIKTALADADWDYITVQQQSIMAGQANTFKNLQNILDYVQQNKTNPNAKIFWHMTWAYQGDYKNNDFQSNYGSNQLTMYNAVVDVAQQLMKNYPDLAGIIPNGTAIQNLRTSALGDTLTRDGFHLSLGIGRYTAAMTYFHALTGISPEKVTWSPKGYTNISKNKNIINQAVENAVKRPYSITSFAEEEKDVMPAVSTVNSINNKNVEIPKSIKILGIGNSFTMDCMEYLWDVCHMAGIEEVYVGYLFYPGAPLQLHFVNTLTGADTYEYYTNSTGKWKMVKGSMKDALADAEWDIITVQQHSTLVAQNDSFSKLPKILEFIHKNKQNPDAKIYWLMTWAYQHNSTEPDFSNFNRDPIKMYQAQVDRAKALMNGGSFDGLIPVGTTIQNARAQVGDILTRDGYHLSLGMGRYLAALTCFHAITGLDPALVGDYRPQGHAKSPWDIPMLMACIRNAVAAPYAVTEYVPAE
ncbi:MAG: DUF4886 domain-containing protein [Clostridiales bacterium]|nr:DUF4886 domain-containing protein [Clostridiales bacterium]